MSLDLPNTIIDFLKKKSIENPEGRYTAREIAVWIFENKPDGCREKFDRSERLETPDDLMEQIISEIGAIRPRIQKKEPSIKITEGRPRKYYYTETSDNEEVVLAERTSTTIATSDSTKITEQDLYPILVKFLWLELQIYSKRIDENRSSNSGGAGANEWLHPDLVGMEDLSKDWSREIKDCVKEYSDKKTKLWAFEVKILINRSNVRKTFFQAVSNSSWANFGYLVASEITEGTIKELRILASLHGIGFIKLNVENPSESEIMIPAREKPEVDWDTANRLDKENKDFRKYIKLVRQSYQTGEVPKSGWDTKFKEED